MPNLNKGPNLSSVDLQTNAIVPLFNQRKEKECVLTVLLHTPTVPRLLTVGRAVVDSRRAVAYSP